MHASCVKKSANRRVRNGEHRRRSRRFLVRSTIMPRMPTLIEKPSVIAAAGNKPKIIEEFIGRVSSKTDALSVARMQSPSGWVEPGQTPGFDEYTVVLRGSLGVPPRGGADDGRAGRRGVHRGLPAGVFDGDGASR